jgi:hypothetical protein
VHAVKYNPQNRHSASKSKRVLPDPEVLHSNLVVQGVSGAIMNLDREGLLNLGRATVEKAVHSLEKNRVILAKVVNKETRVFR